MCLFLDISCRVSDIIPAEWHRQGSRVTSTSSIIGQPRARLSSVESTLLSIVLVAISTQHGDERAFQRRLTTDCIESTLHSVVSVVPSRYLNTQSPTLSAGRDRRVISQHPVTDFVGWERSIRQLKAKLRIHVRSFEAVTRPSRPALHGLTNKHLHTLAHTTSLLFPLNSSLLY